MKRNFKVIKQDKNLSNLSDADIDKLYSTYIEMDGKHQNFKGSKREYCSTVSGMIKDWLKEVVDKNGGISDKSLIGGKGRRKAIETDVNLTKQELRKIREDIKELKEKPIVDVTTDKTIAEISKIKDETFKKIKEIDEQSKIASLNKLGLLELERLNVIIDRRKRNVEKINDSDMEAALAFKHSNKFLDKFTLNQTIEHYDKELADIQEEKKKLLMSPVYKEEKISKNIKKLISNYSDRIAELKPVYLENIKKFKELETEEKLKVKKIEELEIKKDELKSKIPEFNEAYENLEKEKKEEFKKIIKGVEFGPRSDVRGKTLTDIAKERGVRRPEKYTFQELSEEAYEYRRVIKFFLSGEPYPTGTPESHSTYVVRRFLRALPYKKLLEITPEGFEERRKFIADHGLNDGRGNAILWTPEIEESFRSESFVFWKLLAKDVKDKDVVVNNFELVGKIFSHLLYYSTVDFRLKYFTGDSKGVITTSTVPIEHMRSRNPVVGLKKILNVLNESASIEPSDRVNFNNPRIIFTFYRDNANMLSYKQDKDKFEGKLPYELLLEYDLKKLLLGPSGKKITSMILNHKKNGTQLDSNTNLDALKTIIQKTYKEGTRTTEFFPVTTGGVGGVSLPYEFSLPMSINEKIRNDLRIVGYSEDIFGGKEATIKNYVDNYYKEAREESSDIGSAIRGYTGSEIDRFRFPGLLEDGSVVTTIEMQGVTDATDITIMGDDSEEPDRIEGYFREGETDAERMIRIEAEENKKKAEEAAAKLAAIKESSRLTREKKEAEEAAAVAKKEELLKLREEREAKQASEPKKQVIRKKIIKKSETKSAPDEETETLTKLTKEQQAALKKREEEEEGSDEGSGKPLIAKGKPKSYIKKIIKYYR